MKLLKQPKENVKSVCSKHDFQRCFAWILGHIV
jgi:hypothetical protein